MEVLTLEFEFSVTRSLKMQPTILIHPENLEVEVLELFTMVRLHCTACFLK